MTLLSRLRRLDESQDRNQLWQQEYAGLQNLVSEKDAGRLVERLDDGFVRIVDHMGSDDAIVQAARVSYGAGTKKVSDDRGLIRYLIRHYHTTPLEMVEVKFHVRVPMDCWRQWIRHRMASVNEYSTRYSEAIDSAQQALGERRMQSTNNKQGSSGLLENWPDEVPNFALQRHWQGMSPDEFLDMREKELHLHSREVYEQRLALGVAREQARKDLPLSTYTEAYWKIDLHNLFHFLRLRMDSHAQLEIRMYANAIAQLVKPIVPLAWEAFEDFRLNALALSGPEIDAIRKLLGKDSLHGGKELSKRERDELQTKLNSLAIAS